MDIGIWRKSGRRTIHLGRLSDDQEEPFNFKYFPGETGYNDYGGSGLSSSKKPVWKVLWKNLVKQKRKMMVHNHEKKSPNYNAETYSQNFDDGQSGQTVDEYLNDFLPRSFTARYADPSKLLS